MTKALYVEDNPDNIIIVKQILTTIGYEILIAKDGKQAIAIAEQHQPDFILMDLHLPIMNGAEATRIIKQNPQLTHIPVIALTADINSRELFMAAGCDIYLNKPIRPGTLIRTIHQVLAVVDTA